MLKTVILVGDFSGEYGYSSCSILFYDGVEDPTACNYPTDANSPGWHEVQFPEPVTGQSRAPVCAMLQRMSSSWCPRQAAGRLGEPWLWPRSPFSSSGSCPDSGSGTVCTCSSPATPCTQVLKSPTVNLYTTGTSDTAQWQAVLQRCTFLFSPAHAKN